MQQGVRDIDLLKTWCLSSTLNFTRYFFHQRNHRKFVVGRHHMIIANALDDVLAGKTKKLIINIAPRYGKTELAVKSFIAMGLALNPKAKFIHLSYSDDLARDNSSDVQAIMRELDYRRLFDAKATSTNSKKWYTSQGGGLYAVSSAGQVTGFGAGLVDNDDTDEIDEMMPSVNGTDFGGAIIIDDPIKPDDALSSLVRQKVNQKFDTTIRNRVNSRNTPIIIIMQRLNEDDLCGYLMKKEPDEWRVISLPCIYTDENGNEQSLWPFKHTLDELHDLRDKNAWVFDTQYMQNPKPMEGLMYEQEWKTYVNRPATQFCMRKSYTDTADTGSDYLCSIVYDETEIGNFIVDVLFTQKPMEFTEPATAKMFTKHGVVESIIESNNGGRSFARAVEQQMRLMGNTKTKIRWFHQTENKQERIFARSAEVQNMTYMPEGWERMFPQFHAQITGYMKIGNNAHDDAPDALTGTIEHRHGRTRVDVAGMLGY